MLSDKILGAEGLMSKVGIPPPHNLDTPYALVDGKTAPTTTTTTPTQDAYLENIEYYGNTWDKYPEEQ